MITEQLTGPAGTAVSAALPRGNPAALAVWLIDAPGQSPAWSKYSLGVVHLRDDHPGLPPARLQFPTATHELILQALDPDHKPTRRNVKKWRHLRPVNLAEQVELPDDQAAIHLTRLCAQAICAGVLWAEPPLSGQTEPWHTALIRTAAHLRGETHAS